MILFYIILFCGMLCTLWAGPRLCETFELDPTVIDGLVHYAKLQYDCGNYTLSGELLKHYRSMISQDTERPVMTSRQVSCIWGSLASFILNREFEEAGNICIYIYPSHIFMYIFCMIFVCW